MRTPNVMKCDGAQAWVEKFLDDRASMPQSGERGYFWFSDDDGLWLEYYWTAESGQLYATARGLSYDEISRIMNGPWLRQHIFRFIVLLRHEHQADRALWERQETHATLH